MKKFKTLLLLNLVLSIGFISIIAMSLIVVSDAAAHVYHSHDVVEAKPAKKLSFPEIEHHVTQLQYLDSNYPDTTELKQQLQTYTPTSQAEAIQRYYLLARVLQHDHDFSHAEKMLQHALQLAPENASVTLLMASVQNNLGNHTHAEQHCRNLLGVAAPLIVTACIVETNAQRYPQKKAQYHSDLQRVSALSKHPQDNPIAQQWVQQILAELALSLNKPALALSHLETLELSQTSVSYIALWADIHLQLDQAAQVYTKLTALLTDKAYVNDALLLRLAIAEKHTHQGEYWRKAMQQRIAQRSEGHNYSHAAELARYYLLVEVDPAKALHWAQINISHAKARMDVELLESAMTAANSD